MNKKGFTLIELVMIIVILGILAAVAIPRYVDLAGDARLAVVESSVGAMKSSAVIQFGRTKAPNLWTTIRNETELDSNILVTGNSCATTTFTYSGTTTARTFSLSSAFCSG